MTIKGMSGSAPIRLFEDFFGPELLIASTAVLGTIGDFRVIGDGLAVNDSGVVGLETDGLNGVVQLTATDEDIHCCGLATSLMFDVALMGTIVVEARVRFDDLNTKSAFIGLCSVNSDSVAVQTSIISTSTTTITYTASHICGFYLNSEDDDDEDWFAVYKGGTATAITDSTAIDLDDDAVAGEFQVLRLEVDNNGTARWFIDGVLLKTKTGAVSLTANLAALCILENENNTSDPELMDVDYLLVKAGRDWNA